MGKEITLSGLAFDAKGGAVLKLKDGKIVYLRDLAYWSSDLFGKKTSVRGTLQEKKIIPDPVIDEDGAISQGAYGQQYVLENIRNLTVLGSFQGPIKKRIYSNK